MNRLAIFLDGTWNTLNNNTNVWRLRALCDPAASGQLVYYGQGVGTRFGEKVRGGALGYGIDDEIIDAYVWLLENFRPGDEIFIFGFSRGAYAARSLSGLISTCGVLAPGAPLSVQQLYARYRRRTERTIRTLKNEPAQAGESLEDRWIRQYCLATNIKMVGVWDTVGSLGSPVSSMSAKVAKYLFLDTHLRLQNEFAFHALALDEHRRSFEPTFWTKTSDNVATASGPPARPLTQVEQRWFVGAHANVGGGYPSDVLAQPPLKWLMDKAVGLGLRFRPITMDAPDPSALITDSYEAFTKPLFRMFSPRFYRPVGTGPLVGTKRTTSRINETIDGTVFERWRENAAYRPKNLAEWAKRQTVNPASLHGARLATDPAVIV